MVISKMRIARLGSLLFVLALVVAACGTSAPETTTTTSPAPTTAIETTTTLTTAPPLTTTTTAPPLPGMAATSTIIVVQQDLTTLGYFSDAIDGISGPKTRTALAEFQTGAGIASDGVFGPITDAALTLRLQADEKYVIELQEALTELEFYTGPTGGVFGEGTRKGVRLLQESCDLEQTGELDIRTRLCLGGHI